MDFQRFFYCDKNFWLNYIKEREQLKSDIDNHDKFLLLDSLLDILYQPRCRTYFPDGDFCSLRESKEKIFNYMVNANKFFRDKNLNRSDFEQFIDNQNGEDLCVSCFLTTSKQDILKHKKNGLLAFNLNDIKTGKYLFKPKYIIIENCKNWEDIIGQNGQMCHSMILVDNYLLNKTDEGIKCNLIPLLERIISPKLEVVFDLSLVYTLGRKDEKKEDPDEVKEKNKYDKVKEALDGHFGEGKIRFTLYVVNNDKKIKKLFDSHDRYILTNSVYVSCGAGFDLFEALDGNLDDKKDYSLKHSTIMQIHYPVFYNSEGDNNTPLHFRLNQIREIENEYKENLKIQIPSVRKVRCYGRSTDNASTNLNRILKDKSCP